MSGGIGQRRLLSMKKDITSYTGRQLLIRQPPRLAKVPLDGVVISQLKQKLPVFRAMKQTSLNRRFALTAIEEPNVTLELKNHDQDHTLVQVTLSDWCRSVSQLYKERQCTLSVEDLAGGVLENVASKGIIRTLMVIGDVNDHLLQLLFEAEKVTPTSLQLLSCENQESLLPLLQRLASKVQQLCVQANNHDTDWLRVEHCLAPFTNLRRLMLSSLEPPPPPSDWLRNLILANGQLKRLEIVHKLFPSPVVDGAVSAIASVPRIRFYSVVSIDEISEHVETDLCRLGQCTLTKLVLAMPQNGHLKLTYWNCNAFSGDLLRFCHYLLSLHKIGKVVMVKMHFLPEDPLPLPAFIDDLSHYYHPQNEVKTTAADADGLVHRYRLRVGTVTINFYPLNS